MTTGHPVLLPASMGTHSYIATGLERAKETFCAAKRSISKNGFQKQVDNYKQILDEASQAYKDIHLVVNTLAEIGIINLVANVKPLAVIKAEDFYHYSPLVILPMSV